ncbi:YcaO-like family protein [Legionella worsleiensis]|uniref:YcaO-like family protein n=1 Tax=Legionella worsleiensis TaxID=45076 RepID=A0A0W1A9K1_9GAMM|nr:YcaO-like family protein [Legionella worsleiensis]KTD77997.1 YcaO-like family protein [Legionella worsleiensis]STY31522.1 bacteriocin biosynthesis docking scaffold, SagD family [Legionella worsleiensis]
MNQLNFDRLDYFPICRHSHAALNYPVQMKLFSNHLVNTPRSVGVDGVIGYGGATGTGLNLLKKSYGEFLERNHFFTGVGVSSCAALSSLNPILAQKLHSLCTQLKFKNTPPIEEHLFHLTQVTNLITEKPDLYLYNLISLNGKKEDMPFVAFNDSCSCATHSSKEQSLLSSLNEFLERQALVGSWTSKRFRYLINPQLLQEITPYTGLAKTLTEQGELYVLENGLNLPGYSIIIFYFSKSAKDIVQYSVGAGAGFSLQSALNSAFEELWQCYTFQYSSEHTVSLEDKAGSEYHLNFQQCNRLDTKNDIPFFNEIVNRTFDIDSIADLQKHPTFNLAEVISGLSRISQYIYYYHHVEPCTQMHYTKVISPDFFSHMSVDKKLNYDNAYAKTLGLSYDTAYKATIPFP